MSFRDNFCPSPWFHMRITSTGDYEYCRWSAKSSIEKQNIRQIHPVTWFQKNMAPLRQDLIDGKQVEGCRLCRNMEQHGKVSGRQKQLLKTGVSLSEFEKTMLSSPWTDEWRSCKDTQGEVDLYVQDWQIDLGNFCNSACLFCHPESSSRLATEYQRAKLISFMPPRAWADDPALVDKFIETLQHSPHVRYLHFIGGETIITPAFRTILEALIDNKLNQQTTLGFTTNLTVIDDHVIDLLRQFDQINLGVSIECFDPINDYIRFGGQLERTKKILDDWMSLARQHRWTVQMRTTPTILSIARLYTVYEYAWNHGAGVESCNFIDRPAFMRPSVLPKIYRQQALNSMQTWIDSKKTDVYSDQIVNTRHPGLLHQQILQDAQSYVSYLESEPDESHRLPDLVRYLKTMESIHKNCVLDYLPEYEEFLRTAGY